MPPSRIRFVTACQQVLALGVVLAVLTPAASVISLDVVHDRQTQLGVVPDDQASDLAADVSARTASAAPTAFGSPVAVADGLAPDVRVAVSPDLTGDGVADLVVQSGTAPAQIRPGTGTGTFGAALGRAVTRSAERGVVATGDLDEDGRNDLVVRMATTGRVDTLLGDGAGAFSVRRASAPWTGPGRLIGAGDVDGDGHADLLARGRGGRLYLLPGTGDGGFAARVRLPGSGQRYATVAGLGDFTGDGRPDLFVRSRSTGFARVLPGLGGGRFGRAQGPFREFARTGPVVDVAQLVRDGRPDVVVRSHGALQVIGNEGGGPE